MKNGGICTILKRKDKMKFLKLTRDDNTMVLVNPEHIGMIGIRKGYTNLQMVKMGDHSYVIVVQETMDDVSNLLDMINDPRIKRKK